MLKSDYSKWRKQCNHGPLKVSYCQQECRKTFLNGTFPTLGFLNFTFKKDRIFMKIKEVLDNLEA